ncbi:MAG: hypothetical protein ABSC30_14345 [Acidimicrobiales bacterium]
MTNVVVSNDSSTVLNSTVTDSGDKGAQQLLDFSLLGVLIVSSLVFYGLSTHGTWNPLYEGTAYGVPPERFFLAQAQAITHGRLWVNPSQLYGDCFVHDGRCYGYFGLTPSLLRLPLLPLLDHYRNGFTPVFITAGLTLAAGGFLASLRHVFSRMRLGKAASLLVALLGFGFGAASILAHLSPPDVYDEAIVWSVGFLSLAVFCFIRWWERQQSRWYVLLLVSLVMATNARPTALPFALIIGLGVGYRLWNLRRIGSVDWAKSVVLGSVMVVVPMATCIGVFLLKFGQPIPSYLLDQQVGSALGFPPPSPNWVEIRKRDHNQLTSLRFMATAMFAYLRPDTLVFTRAFPWVDFRFHDLRNLNIQYIGLRKGSLYVETVSSLTATMPFSFLVFFGAALYRLRRWGAAEVRHLLPSPSLRSGTSWKGIALAAAFASWCVVLVGVAVEDRFLGDAYPLVALLLLFGLPSLVKRVDRGGRVLKAGAIVVVVVGMSWQLLVNVGLAWRFPGIQARHHHDAAAQPLPHDPSINARVVRPEIMDRGQRQDA